MIRRAIDWILYGLVRAVSGCIRVAGPRAGYRFAAAIGGAWYHLFRQRRLIIHRNLEIAFGDRLTPHERGRIGKQCCSHTLAVAIDAMVRDRSVRRENWREFCTLDPVMEEALSSEHPRGIVFLSAHLGSWEMGHYICGLLGKPVHVVMRRFDNPHIDRQAARLRSGFGEEIFYKVGALRKILRALRKGERVAILADQNVRQDPEFLDFFGLPAATLTSHARVLVRQRCDVVFCVCLREGYDFRFRFHSRLLEAPRQGSAAERARALVRAYLSALEEVIREHPEQYLWMHRRWKTRPDGAPSPYGDLRRPFPRLPRAAAEKKRA